MGHPHIPIQDAIARLNETGLLFETFFRHGTLSVELYQPAGADHQQPHLQDEVYVVARGEGTFVVSDTRVAFKAGDVLFAPAGAVHRFETFSEDFLTWVIFYGPEGGEGSE
ncbi:MAG: cupin domain-containing protein [Saprospiraceae bacterium]|nr:cupin domain-containing protein [Saprospiraceae bacterium]